jgi:hypothetical protein
MQYTAQTLITCYQAFCQPHKHSGFIYSTNILSSAKAKIIYYHKEKKESLESILQTTHFSNDVRFLKLKLQMYGVRSSHEHQLLAYLFMMKTSVQQIENSCME